MLLATFRCKKFFFDRLEVQRRIGEKQAKFLRNAGRYVQRTAQRSMRRVGKKGKPSKAGQPPKWHGNEQFSLRTILFAMNSLNNGIIVGAVRGNQKHYQGSELVTGTVPKVQEDGGRIGLREKFRPFDWRSAIENFGAQRAAEYFRLFGFLSEQQWGAIYKADFKHRVDRARGGIWVPVGRRRKDRFLTRTRVVRYEARPFMSAALVKTAKTGKFPGLWFGNMGEAA